MSHVATRRAPNAMNFLRQLEVLRKSGEASDFTDTWACFDKHGGTVVEKPSWECQSED